MTVGYTYNASAHEAFIVNGAIGGIASAVQGGEFGNGFIAAGFSCLAGGVIGQIENPVGKVVTRGIIGGTISEVTGGKFTNGASSAAFAQIIGDFSDYAMSDDRKNQVTDWSQADEDWLQETMAQTAIDLENGDVYASNWDWRGENVQQCISGCISSYYGDMYTWAGYLSPLSLPSFAASELATGATEELSNQGNRNSYARSRKQFNTGQRQLKTLKQFNRFNAVNAVLGAGALDFQAGAYGYCRVSCTFRGN